MQANSKVMGSEVREYPLTWVEASCWAERVFTRERLVSVGMVAGGLAALLGMVVLVEYSIYQAVQSWTMSGVGATVFGFF
jgi:hypothetical protein